MSEQGRQLPLAEGEQVAGYRIESYLARGGMAVVYRALDVALGRRVALKLIAPELARNDKFRLRFMRESKLAAAIDHPNILPIYGAGEADGLLYIAMRYVDGHDLGGILVSQGPLSPEVVLPLSAQIASALDAAHAHELVHRDVKPGNILVASAAGPVNESHAYLTDFGLTKRSTSPSRFTTTGHFIGTIAYVAPEQIAGRTVDHRADIYALSCVLFEALAGVPPFQGDHDAAILWAHISDSPPSLATLRPDLPPAIDAVLQHGMAKDPEDRPTSCRTVISELSAALSSSQWRLSGQRPAAGPDAVGPARSNLGTALAPTQAKAPDTVLTEPTQAPMPTAQTPASTGGSPPPGPPAETTSPTPAPALPAVEPRSSRRRRSTLAGFGVAAAGAAVLALILVRHDGGTPQTGSSSSLSGGSFGSWAAARPLLRPVEAAGTVAFANRVWVLGGNTPTRHAVRDVQVYDPSNGRWSFGPALPKELHDVVAVSTGSALYAIGGATADGRAVDTTYRLDAPSGPWHPDAPLPQPRAAGAGAWDGSRLVYGGGIGPDQQDRDQVWALANRRWSDVSTLTLPRDSMGAATDGKGTVWFLAGQQSVQGNVRTSGRAERLNGSKLTRLPDVRARRGVAAVYARGGPCVIGGADSTRRMDPVMECLRPAPGLTPPPLLTPRAGLGAAALGTTAYTAGGFWPNHSDGSMTVETLAIPG